MFQLQPFPTTEWNLIRFARYIANGVTSYDTVKGYLSAVKRFHELSSICFPDKLHLLKIELMSIKRELANAVKKAVLATPELLRQICHKVDLSSALEMTCYVDLLIVFCLFLRKSNLVPDTQGMFNDKEQLTRADVWKMGKLTLVDIRWSKTNQHRQKELLLPLVPAKHREICPVYWINQLFRIQPGLPLQSPLFSYRHHGRVIPITYDVLSKKYKEWVSAIGKDNTNYLTFAQEMRSKSRPDCRIDRRGC